MSTRWPGSRTSRSSPCATSTRHRSATSSRRWSPRALKTPATYVDFRKLLDDKTIDAISIATPNHWHTLQTIWACQAGKDVYVEKPCSHNVFESQQIVAAARKYDRMVQQGSQSRSSPALQEAVQRLNEGEFGEVYMARGLCFKWRDTIGKTPVSAGPAGRRLRPVDRARADARVHQEPLPLQLALVLGHRQRRPRQPGHPRSRHRPLGSRRDASDQGQRHRRQVHVRRRSGDAEHDYGVLRVRRRRQEEDDDVRSAALDTRNHEAGINGEKPGNTIGNSSTARRAISSSTTTTSTTRSWASDQKPGPAATKGDTHYENFIDAVRSRKRQDLNAEIEEGALSCNLMHLANISYRLGRTLHWDAKTLTCIGDAEANKMLTRAYRAPYVVPKNV